MALMLFVVESFIFIIMIMTLWMNSSCLNIKYTYSMSAGCCFVWMWVFLINKKACYIVSLSYLMMSEAKMIWYCKPHHSFSQYYYFVSHILLVVFIFYFSTQTVNLREIMNTCLIYVFSVHCFNNLHANVHLLFIKFVASCDWFKYSRWCRC